VGYRPARKMMFILILCKLISGRKKINDKSKSTIRVFDIIGRGLTKHFLISM